MPPRAQTAAQPEYVPRSPPADGTGQNKMQKKRKWKNGTVTKREIRKLSNTTNLQLPRATFARLVREITCDYHSALRWNAAAIDALQDAAETYLTGMFQRADKAREFKGRMTLNIRDMQYSQRMDSIEAGQEP